MSKQRASIFDADADAEALDVSSFHPKTQREAAAPTREEAKAIAEAASFPSRQAVKPAPTPAAPQPVKREPRRHRTAAPHSSTHAPRQRQSPPSTPSPINRTGSWPKPWNARLRRFSAN
jgi:hypothetical protein